MKDANDNHTADLLTPEKKPLSPAQRKQAQWTRDLALIEAGNWSKVTKNGLIRCMTSNISAFPAWAEFGKRADFLTDWQLFNGQTPVKK
jgi:hypothetical protein